MKTLRDIAFLKVELKPADRPPEEDGRVVELFRNRAELKKAYGEVQSEIHRLKDRLKQQEGATRRVQEMLEVLEERLGATETAYPAIVFYHLRGLWQLGRELLEQLAGELGRQQEERERKQHFAESNRRSFVKRQTIESQLRAAEAAAADEHQRLADLDRERARLTRLWHYFKRRDLDRRLLAARATRDAADLALADARAAFEQIEASAADEFPGLTIEARRAINLATIAYAEALCVRLAKTDLVQLARQAVSRREATDDYGERAVCEALIAQIAKARAVLQQRPNAATEIKPRTERMRQTAAYRSGGDTVPIAESLLVSDGDVLAGRPEGIPASRLPNVLVEDTWEIFKVLLR